MGSEARPIRVAMGVEAKDGLDAVIKFSGPGRFCFGGPPRAAMAVAIEPAQPATRAPAFAIPEATGTRLEIGDFSFKGEVANRRASRSAPRRSGARS